MLWFGVISLTVITGVLTFITLMNRHGEKLEGEEENPKSIWANEEWYKDDGPPDG